MAKWSSSDLPFLDRIFVNILKLVLPHQPLYETNIRLSDNLKRYVNLHN